MYTLVLLRHGESLWNKANKFTGWTDVDITEKGIEEAHRGGVLLREKGFKFDLAFCSRMKKSIRTLWIILDEMDLMWIPVTRSWQINERHYGALQGLNKSETAQKYGEEQVLIWRRSFSTRPPALEKSDPRYPGNDPMYADLKEDELPVAESLADTIERVVPYWKNEIAPKIKAGKKVIIAAHGNSLRALVKYLDGISDDDILKMNIPTATPLIYQLDENLKPISKEFIGDPERIKKAMASVANQGKA